jgi:hypothetical protein
MPLLLEKIREDGLDVVCGWCRKRCDPLHKIIAARVADYLRGVLLNESIHDAGCLLRICPRRVLKGIILKGEQQRFITVSLKRKGFAKSTPDFLPS